MTDTPADIDALELDALWEEFHRAVNMTSMELGAWLGALPDDTDTGDGERVLAVLHKRRAELTDDDVDAMYTVVDAVAAEAPAGTDPDIRRGELMALGHDPGKAA